jgi:hypothetical protein
MAKKTLKRKHTVKQIEKPSSIFFADYSNSKPKRITHIARPMFLAPEYNPNTILRAAGTNVMDVKLTPEEEKKLKKVFKKIDYSKITNKGEIIDTAIDQILGAEDDPNKRNQLQTLLRMTNYMENKYGASDAAWNNKKVNLGFVELDKVAINDLFTPKGDKGNYTKGQKNNFEYLKSFGLEIQPEFTWQSLDEYEPSIHRSGVMDPMTFELDSLISKCEIHFVLSE